MIWRLFGLLVLAFVLAGCADDSNLTQGGVADGPVGDGPRAPSVLYLGTTASEGPCHDGQEAIGTGAGADSHWYTYWNFTYGAEASIRGANATIWMSVSEPFVLPSTLGWSFHNNDYGEYRLGGDYWGGDQAVVQPGLYTIDVQSQAFGDTRERTFLVGEELGIFWATTQPTPATSPPFTVLCEPGHMSQMWIDYEPTNDA